MFSFFKYQVYTSGRKNILVNYNNVMIGNIVCIGVDKLYFI